MKAVKSGLLIDCTGAKPIKDGVVLIDDGKIIEAGTSSKVHIPNGTEIIDVGDHTVLAGMIDPHQHFRAADRRPKEKRLADGCYKILWGVRELQKDLETGCTTVRLAGQLNYEELPLMQAFQEELFAGPRVMTCGKALRTPASHGNQGTIIEAGVVNVLNTIRENFAHGATSTKIFISGYDENKPVFLNRDESSTFWTREEIKAAIDETHRLGGKTCAHANGGLGVTWYIEMGGDSVDHGRMLTEEQMDLMLEKGTYLSITVNSQLQLSRAKRWSYLEMFKDPIKAAAARAQRAIEAREKKVISMAIKKGVLWTTNQDIHFGLHPWIREFLVNKYGVSPMDAILANTRRAAECCGILDKVGTLEPGKYADLFSCKGNPLEDITALQKIGIVMLGGKEYDFNTHHWKGKWDFDNIWNALYTKYQHW